MEAIRQNSQAYVAKAQENLAALQEKLRQDIGERANTLIRLAQSCCLLGELVEPKKRLDYFEKGKYYAELLIRENPAWGDGYSWLGVNLCGVARSGLSALRRSMAQCRFERALFLTDRPVDAPGIDVVLIPPIASIADYSRFMVKSLADHIRTGFALVVQYDGYVLAGTRWEAAFQNYDYVGAPWGRPSRVGNGGLSLRSRKLLQALRDPRIEQNLVPEDLAICETYRSLLETEHGIRFAPPQVAARFSFETLTPPGPTLGFHGIAHLVRIVNMSDEEIAAYRPPPMITW